MNIRMMPLTFHAALACILCGEELTPDVEIAIAYDDTGNELGPVCTRCVESNAAQLRQRVQDHMGTLHQDLATLDHLVSKDQGRTHRS